MNHIKITLYRIIVILIIGLFTNCSAEIVATAPPGAVIVAPGIPPFIGAVWIGGEYRWDKGTHRYIEVGGHWTKPRTGRTWVGGSWRSVNGGYKWNHGHWR